MSENCSALTAKSPLPTHREPMNHYCEDHDIELG